MRLLWRFVWFFLFRKRRSFEEIVSYNDEPHNNISHCCASGCDGVACQETGKPWRIGDF